MNHGFIKVAAAISSVKVADCTSNAASILELIKQAVKKDVQIICFPELAVTAYTCGDLFHNHLLIEEAETSLGKLLEDTKEESIICIVGIPVKSRNQLFNAAVVFQGGKILAVIPKTYLASYNEFYENRWFSSALDVVAKEVTLCGQTAPIGADILLNSTELCFSVEICEDFWTPIPPSSYQALAGSELIFNLSASNELVGKNNYRKQLVTQQAARCIAGYVYVSSGFGEADFPAETSSSSSPSLSTTTSRLTGWSSSESSSSSSSEPTLSRMNRRKWLSTSAVLPSSTCTRPSRRTRARKISSPRRWHPKQSRNIWKARSPGR